MRRRRTTPLSVTGARVAARIIREMRNGGVMVVSGTVPQLATFFGVRRGIHMIDALATLSRHSAARLESDEVWRIEIKRDAVAAEAGCAGELTRCPS